MKKILIMIITSMIIASSFTACQKTPDSEIVIGKGDATLEDTINDKANESDIQNMKVPKKLETEIGKNEITLSVNANIDIPNSEQYSVACVVPEEISQETANKIWDTLVGETVLYEGLEWDYKTKSETEHIIMELQKVISDSDEPQQKDLENLDKWENWYNDAPETIELIETSKTFKDIDVDADLPAMPEGLSEEEETAFRLEMSIASSSLNTKEISGTGTDNNGFYVNLRITENSVNYSKSINENGYIPTIWDKKDTTGYENKIENSSVSLEQALQTAKDTITDIGVNYFGLSDTLDGYEVIRNDNGEISSLSPAFIFTFTRELNGVTENLVANSTTIEELDSLVAMQVQNENIQIIITANGIVSLKWNNPSVIKETLSENVELLSFDEINSIFTNQMFLSNNDLDIEK